MLITYKGTDEVLVTTRKREKAFIKEWFGKDMGRDLEEYDRVSHDLEDGIELTAHLIF